MSWLQTWMIDGKVIAQAPCPQEITGPRNPEPPESKVFFCNTCGEIYARRIITPNTYWHVYNHQCSKHQTSSYMEPGGSIWVNWEKDYLKNLPLEVLKYETLLRLEFNK